MKTYLLQQQGDESPLEKMGFPEIGWHRRYAIPLSRPAAFLFYIHHLILPHSLREILWVKISRRWPWLGCTLLHIHRLKSNRTHLPGSKDANANSNLTDVKSLHCDLQLHLKDAGIEVSGSLALLTLNDHKTLLRGKTVAFIFDDSSKHPIAIAKLSATGYMRSSLRYEHETLLQLENTSSIADTAGMPQSLCCFESSPWTVSLQTYLPGHTAYYEMRRSWNALEHAPGHFRTALNWLIEFQRGTGIRRTSMGYSEILHYVMEPLQKYASMGFASEKELQLIEKTAHHAKDFLDATLVLAAGHGDFWAGNLMLHRNSVSVIDWEHYKSEAVSLDDLFFFSTTYGLNYPWKAAHWAVPETAFRATYLQSTDIAGLVRECLLDYCQAMDMEAELLEIFFPVFLAKKAIEGTSCESVHKEKQKGDSYKTEQNPLKNDFRAGSGRAEIWRHLFRIYAERREPACFIHRRKSLEAAS